MSKATPKDECRWHDTWQRAGVTVIDCEVCGFKHQYPFPSEEEVAYARKVTGVEEILTIMGGFHLSGADFEKVIAPTVAGLKAMRPRYVVPTHCTGRDAVMHVEKEMPEAFLLNMAGTKLTFSA